MSRPHILPKNLAQMPKKVHDTPGTPVRAIDLFYGIGGNSWGAKAAGAQVVAGFDMWELAGKVYKDNFPEASFYEGKLQECNPTSLKKELGQIDLLLASPECTSHSVARGNRKKNEESLKLAYQVLRFANALKPRWIVIENVVSMKNWSEYDDFLAELAEQYYYLEQPLTASDFDVPQSRRRLFIICDRDQQPLPVTPAKSGKHKTAAGILNMNGVYKYSSLESKTRAQATLDRAKRAYRQIGRKEPFLIVYYGSDAAGGWQRLEAPLRTITTLDRFALIKPKPGRKGHFMRMLQPPELRAAMGFPSGFKLTRGTRREQIHMLGNAVCPPVMKAIVESLLHRREGDGLQD